MPSRVPALATLALLVGLWVGAPTPTAAAPAPPTPRASAEPSPPTATEEPSPTCPAVGCLPTVIPSATTSPTPSPTPSAKPTKTATPSPTRSRRPRSTPRPAATSDGPDEPAGPPVTASFGFGAVGGSTATPDTAKASASAGDKLDRIFGLVLLSAIALGFAGITGLYVTRHRPLH